MADRYLWEVDVVSDHSSQVPVVWGPDAGCRPNQGRQFRPEQFVEQRLHLVVGQRVDAAIELAERVLVIDMAKLVCISNMGLRLILQAVRKMES